MKGKYSPVSSEKMESCLGSEHMSSLQRQVASCYLNLFLFLCQPEQEAKGSEAALEKGVRKAWGHQKLSTF